MTESIEKEERFTSWKTITPQQKRFGAIVGGSGILGFGLLCLGPFLTNPRVSESRESVFTYGGYIEDYHVSYEESRPQKDSPVESRLIIRDRDQTYTLIDRSEVLPLEWNLNSSNRDFNTERIDQIIIATPCGTYTYDREALSDEDTLSNKLGRKALAYGDGVYRSLKPMIRSEKRSSYEEEFNEATKGLRGVFDSIAD